jgi:molybdopterin biosynthesis enzyme
LHRPIVSAIADADLRREADGKLHLLRAHVSLDGPAPWRVRTTGGQESHQLHSMSEANALILLPDGTGTQAGEPIDVLLIDPDRLSLDTSLVLNVPHSQREAP